MTLSPFFSLHKVFGGHVHPITTVLAVNQHITSIEFFVAPDIKGVKRRKVHEGLEEGVDAVGAKAVSAAGTAGLRRDADQYLCPVSLPSVMV